MDGQLDTWMDRWTEVFTMSSSLFLKKHGDKDSKNLNREA